MAYIVNGSALFLHPPKVGGKATLASLRGGGIKCRPVRSPGCHNGHAIEADLRDDRYRWDFRFGFVRHPVRWWRSLRDFANQTDSKLFDIDDDVRHPLREILDDCRELRDATADEFVREIGTVRHPGFCGRMFRRYYGEQFERVEWIGRQETLEADLFDLCRIRGWRWPVMRRANVSHPWTPGKLKRETIDRLLAFEAETVDRFYSQEGGTLC